MKNLNYSKNFVKGLMNFHKNFNNGNVNLEDSVLWYCLDMGMDWYLNLNINEKINFKQSYFKQ